jgi:hypothetical protein
MKSLVAASHVIFTCTKPWTGDEKVPGRVLLLLLLDTLCFNLIPYGTTIIYQLYQVHELQMVRNIFIQG